MEVISLNTFIDKTGLFIKPDDLNDFINSNVRITIEKISIPNSNKAFLNYAGTLDKNDAEVLEKSIDECRKVDLETWLWDYF